jgi:hypothetical protein
MFTHPQAKTYLLILVGNWVWILFNYVFAATICTGTGMGGNQVLMLCQDAAPWLTFALNTLIFVGILSIVQIFKPRPLSANLLIVNLDGESIKLLPASLGWTSICPPILRRARIRWAPFTH